MDKISIITVTYNCVNEVEKTIKDALSLDYPDYEVIVIDGASKDGTCELLNKYKEQFAYFVSEPDKGIYDAMNKGICAATGDWIIFQNVGDVFDGKDVLKRIFSKQWDDTDILYGDGQVVYTSGLKYMKPWGPFYLSTKRLHGMGFSHQSVFVRSSWAKKYPFDLSFRCCADYNMMVSCYKNGAKFNYVPISVTICEGRFGFSESHRMLQLTEEARICGVENTLYFKIIKAKRTLVRKIRKTIKS